MAQRTKEGTWRVYIRIGGKRISRTFPNRDLARDFEAKVRLEKYQPQTVKPSAMRFEDFAQKWLYEYAAVEKEPTSAAVDESFIRCHLTPAFGPRPIGSLTEEDLRQLKARMKASGKLKAKTVNNVLGLGRKMLATAVAWKMLPVSPWAGVNDLEVGDQDFAYWEPADLRKFVEAIRSAKVVSLQHREIVDVVQFAAGTGLRLGEIEAVRHRDIDWQRRQVKVKATVSARLKLRLERTKNKKIAWVPLSEQVWKIVQRREAFGSDDPIFKAEAMNGVTQKFQRLCKVAGVPVIRFHDLRHTFASHLVMAGVEIYTVSRLMRHSNVTQTMRYAHLAPSFLAAEVEKLGPEMDRIRNPSF